MSSTEDDAPIDAVHAFLSKAGVLARPLRRILAMLGEDTQPLERLIQVPAVPHRTVEELLAAAGSDLESDSDGYRLSDTARESYHRKFALDEVDKHPAEPEILDRIRTSADSGPRPEAALDHVKATPESVLRRAEWLRDTYDLVGAKVLFLGDHDLTSIALCLVAPLTSVTVVDLDERILAHIDGIAAEHTLAIQTVHSDLRFGLAPALARSADLIFTDPPYTPEGIGLFATRAAEALAGSNGRVLIAYGFSDRSPALGHKVQQELLRLGMVFEAILPGFHRYHGAQAIGSASDLYVCQPTSQTRKLATRRPQGIYTHGPQSVEAQSANPTEEFLRVVSERAGVPIGALRAPGWASPISTTEGTAGFDLRADPGPWLLRMLLACNASRAAFVLGNHHPDITSESAQHALSALIAPKYSLRLHRSTPDSRHAIVVASENSGSPLRAVLRRAHGKLGNTLREALIASSDPTISQRVAAERIRQLIPNTADLDLRLIDLPRHRLAELLGSGLGR